MLKLLVPVLFLVFGGAAGGGVAYVLKNNGEDHAEAEADCIAPAQEDHAEDTHAEPPELPPDALEYVKLNNQFVIPVIDKDRVRSMVVMALSIEVAKGKTETIYSHEPKLRDMFLRVMFDHAHAGGFDEGFTDSRRLDLLRKEFRAVARALLGDVVQNVLITEIARQDV